MKVFQGTLVHSTEQNPMQILTDQLIGIDRGKIQFVANVEDSNDIQDRYEISSEDITTLGEYEFLMPGLVDTHIHAPQYVFTGTSMDLPLLEWLEKYTFPTEAKFADPTFAKYAYNKVVKRTLMNGTTTACYFATIHLKSTQVLCDIIEDYGQRAYVGKVNADQNSPDYYIETTMQSIRDTEKFIDSVLTRENPLLTPVVTPRFAPVCSEHLLSSLGEIAAKYNVPIQSHISESVAECRWVEKLFPQCKHYTDVYDKHKLLNHKTVMAHGVHLSNKELDVFKQRGAGVSHCPNSNTSLHSGHLDSRNLLCRNVKTGLGTDVAGGYSVSMFDAIRQCIQVSNTVGIQHRAQNGYQQDYKTMNLPEAFHLATLGSSQVLGLDDQIGSFEPRKEFDALRINPATVDSNFDIFPQDKLEDIINKFMFLGDDRNIQEVYVSGKKVHTSLSARCDDDVAKH